MTAIQAVILLLIVYVAYCMFVVVREVARFTIALIRGFVIGFVTELLDAAVVERQPDQPPADNIVVFKPRSKR